VACRPARPSADRRDGLQLRPHQRRLEVTGFLENPSDSCYRKWFKEPKNPRLPDATIVDR
jgi:hypothetical protein